MHREAVKPIHFYVENFWPMCKQERVQTTANRRELSRNEQQHKNGNNFVLKKIIHG